MPFTTGDVGLDVGVSNGRRDLIPLIKLTCVCALACPYVTSPLCARATCRVLVVSTRFGGLEKFQEIRTKT